VTEKDVKVNITLT